MLARYPVKSMTGERLDRADLVARGVVGDREWAVRTEDGGLGSGKTTRRFRRVDGLLELRASLPGPVPVIHEPSGPAFRADDPDADDRLSAVLGRPVTLRTEGDVPHHDDSPVHVVIGAALRALGTALGGPVDVARFRPNVVVELDEDPVDAQGRELRLGEQVVLRIGPPMPRCRMVDLPQHGLGRDPRVLRELARGHGAVFGWMAEVVRPGTVHVGDAARLS